VRETREPNRRRRAETRFALARALEAVGNRDEADRMADEAREDLVAAGPAGALMLAELDAWRSE
jgi:hypothetical protein